jgi:hypothetical protein
MKEPVKPLWHPTQLNWVAIPQHIAECPECGSGLVADSNEWVAATGQPYASGLQIECVWDDDEQGYKDHSYRQSDWQPVRDAVAKWCGAID